MWHGNHTPIDKITPLKILTTCFQTLKHSTVHVPTWIVCLIYARQEQKVRFSGFFFKVTDIQVQYNVV